MATELGQAYVQIMPSAKGISGAISRQLNPEASAAGQSAGGLLGGKLVTVLKGAVATAAIGKAIATSISAGADLQQSLGGIETLFKGSADKVKKYANEAYKTSGLSANDYMENVTSFSASLLQSLGGNTAKAADQANTAMVDMADNSNKMGTSLDLIQNAYQGFAKQNYTMLDNLKLGYGGTKTEMERLLKDATKLTGVKYDINNLSDVYSAIHAVQGQLGITGTTAKEAASTLSGSLASMKSAASNVLAGLSLGQDITPALQSLISTTSTFLFDNLIPMIGNIIKGLPTVISTFLTEGVPQLLESVMNLITQVGAGISESIPTFISKFSQLIPAITTWLSTNLPTFLNTGVQILTNIGNGIIQGLPQLIGVASSLIDTFVSFLFENWPKILNSGATLLVNLISGIVQNLPAIGTSAIQAAGKFIDTIVQKAPTYVQTGFNILAKLVSGILNNLPSLISTAFSLVTKFAGMIIQKLPSIIAAGVEILLSLIGGILKSLPSLLKAVGRIGSTIIDNVTKIDLLGAGKAIMESLLEGLQKAWGKVKEFVGGIADWIKKHKGPISYDRKLLVPAGNAIMSGLNSGLIDEFKNVKRTVAGMGSQLGVELQPQIATTAGQLTAQLNADTTRFNNLGRDDFSDTNSTKALELLQAIADKRTVIDGSSVSSGLSPYISQKSVSRTQTVERGGAVEVRF
ncbi:phage tail protein [Lapidilactobacillus wuchangensis]|uniref:phage tail protein n=1 Tax=Lapidilactobacillus wuchangensis TaxID=2486001 RepID=UPI000F78ACA3|nr:PblA [Lapidilactobacillus wuchangensis]